MTWLSIITVVRDDYPGLERTKASIDGNDRHGVEWIVIDSSADRDSVARIIADSGVCTWVPPRGVYPAMNCGLDRARGEFVLFLNAGDEFYSCDTLTRVRSIVTVPSCTWAFGRIEIIEPDGSQTITPEWDYSVEKRHFFARGSFPSHQATFTRTAALRALGGFDETYSITADYKAFLQVSKLGEPTLIPDVVARFHSGGISTTRWFSALREFHRARTEVLRPHGLDRLSEMASTAAQGFKVAGYRLVLAPARRLARR